MGAHSGGAVLDRIVYRWQERDLLGGCGLGPVATSLSADRLPVWGAELARHVVMDVDVATGPYTSVCWARTTAGPALIHREFALHGHDNTPGNVAHALLDPGRVLGPHVVLALGVFDWAAGGPAPGELTPGYGLTGMPSDGLVALAHERAGGLRAAARDRHVLLTRVAETLLARPRAAVSLLLRDAGPDPVPLLWGVFDLVSHLVRGSWSFSTYETQDDASRPRFVVLPRWPAEEASGRTRIDPERDAAEAGDGLYAEAARRLVACYTDRPWEETRALLRELRPAAELDPEPKAQAILAATTVRRTPAPPPAKVSLVKAGRGKGVRIGRHDFGAAAAGPAHESRPGAEHFPIVPPPGWDTLARAAGNARADQANSPGDGSPATGQSTGETPATPAWRPQGGVRKGEFTAAGHRLGNEVDGVRAADSEATESRVRGEPGASPEPARPAPARPAPSAPRAQGVPSPPPFVAPRRAPVAPPRVERPRRPAPEQPETRYLPVAFPASERPAAPVGGPGAAKVVPPAPAAPTGKAVPPAPAAPPPAPARPAPRTAPPAPQNAPTRQGAAAVAAAAAALARTPRSTPVPAVPTPRDWHPAAWAEDGVSGPARQALADAANWLAGGGQATDAPFQDHLARADLVAVAVGLERAEEALLPALVERLGALVSPPGQAWLPSPREQAALERVVGGLDGPLPDLDRSGVPRHRIAAIIGRFTAYVLDGCQTDSMAEHLAAVVRNLDSVSGTYRPYQQELIRAAVAHGLGARFFEEVGRLWAASRSLLPDPADPLEG